MTIINSKSLVEREVSLMQKQVAQLRTAGIVPKIITVYVGSDPASYTYSRQKQKFASKLGIDYGIKELADDASTEEVLAVIEQLNNDESVQGIMVEMPLPDHIDRKRVVLSISPNKDCDAIHPAHLGNLLTYSPTRIPNTPLAAISLLEEIGTDFKGKHAVMVGRSAIVGKPLAELLLQKECTVTLCHRQSQNLKAMTQAADILCVAIGSPEFITGDMVKEGAIVIDIGINFNDQGKLVGDVDFASVAPKAKAISPVPGGVGPVTNVMLFKQFVDKLRAECYG
ncbi:bifunctional 5,10-methylenetetrahydrofolate dehydrogenase/5,10-methenyltetrahydrofolate cyclohydrolase [Aerococcus kribbianus]|uniref:Bifunctional protein FolD n=1 Tax=Aerococcus kribbianus TaxID=2999064 RepID=A0A9X3FVI9_9LACT|nr:MULTISPECIES: bifunctional 5,10-methylenetetrahydrofolate dehydrogenase/5,10-methenyltetrahydrofolate cyclohydrolase [unclassified Aerococcus]MCZ0717014.1 bifunctional 5,10-methylenetetrahydrofolate dehydrogenase/5,10-methenyltetrahydrofolate cyclohydrolase [Aerococcus sp. YH-aer221]MCZ0725302.1 bifunctional 5,10-methylenetetrahydrofolate dehydrogenase/5,10-methenyltetrahydrofolate cyclohydrolase [Aerococcus sp. YH-aer222]